jgi:hypothetical protein
MSNLTRKLWKVADAETIEVATTTEVRSMKDEIMKLLRTKASLVAFVGIVLVMLVGSWLGL